MKLAYFALILPLFGFSCAPVAESKVRIKPGRYAKTIQVGEQTRSYVLRIPKAYDNRTLLPVVILYHGWSSSADQAEKSTEFGAKAEQEGFILAIPNGTEGLNRLKGWNCGFLNLGVPDCDDVEFTKKLLDVLVRDLYVDQKRVYVAGHSNGGMMAHELGARLGDRIAAIGVVAGAIGTPTQRVADPKEPISAILIHGKEDPTVAYDEESPALLSTVSAPESARWWATKAGATAPKRSETAEGRVLIDRYSGRDGVDIELITLTEGGHLWPTMKNSPISATDLIWSFFEAHPKR